MERGANHMSWRPILLPLGLRFLRLGAELVGLADTEGE